MTTACRLLAARSGWTRLGIGWIFFLALGFCLPARGGESGLVTNRCPQHSNADLDRLESRLERTLEAADAQTFWRRFRAAYKAWGGEACLDARYEEVMDSFVVESLQRYWNQLAVLQTMMKADPEFDIFVLTHFVDGLSESAEKDLLTRARNQCPPGATGLCRRIQKTIEELNANCGC